MPSIDERIVSMAFENQVFEQRVSQTMTTLTKLDTQIKNLGGTTGFANIEKEANKVTLEAPMSALDKLKARLSRSGEGAEALGEIDKAGNKVTLEGPVQAIDKVQGKMDQLSAGSTFTDIEKAASRVSLEGVGRAIDTVQAKFSVLEGAAAVALGNITTNAVMKGGAFAKSFAFGPIQQGFEEYSTNLGSIQTILANTEGQQVTGLKNVNKYLGQLNDYSDKTIYNFGQMAKNIGTFTAAGVDLPKSVESIKGIANLAALSGSNSQQASTAMYQLSQAIAAGRVGLQDWNSVVNAGMGGAVFQKALMRTAENMGAIKKGALEIDKATGKATINGQSFRESIMAKPGEQSWLTSDVLTKTLGQFTGDMTDAQLAAEGFNAEQIKAIQATAKSAQNAATEVKTLPQVFDIARETIGSGWAKTFQNIFGDFGESKKTFTEMSNFINGFITRTSDARNKMLEDWKKLGGRTELIEGVKAGFEALMSVVEPIKDAFRDIFPAKTGKDLFELTKRFRDFMENLKIGPETADGLKRTFRGFFAILSIGWHIVKQTAGVFADLLGVVGKGSGGFLNFTGSIGDFLVSIEEAITKGGALNGFFETLGAVLEVPVSILGTLADLLGGLFGGVDSGKADEFAKSTDRVRIAITPMDKIIMRLRDAWATFVDTFNEVKDAVSPALTEIADQFSNFAEVIGDAIKNADWDAVAVALQTGILGGIFLTLKKALGGGIADIGGGFLSNINDVLKQTTGNLQAMQKNVQADTLLKIASAIVVLAAGIFIISTIPADKLTKSMTAIAVGLGQLVGAMALMTKVGGGLGAFAAVPVMAASMIALATAMVILAGAMKIFSTMSWEELAKGLIGVGGGLAAIGLGIKLIGPSVIPAALALIPLAIGLNILAVAMKQFGAIGWEEMAKGLIGIGTALVAIAFGMTLMPPTLIVTGVGLVAVAAGLTLLSAAVATFGSMDLGKMAQGIIGIGAALVVLAVGMSLMPPTLPLTAAGLVIVAAALTAMGGAIAIFGSMNVGKLVKGLAALAGTLVILAVGLSLMAGTLPGSAALLAAAAAFAVLGPTLAFLGTLEWSTIFKGLAAIALVLGTLAVVGALASVPLLALGAALSVLGAGMLLAAGSVYLFAKGLALLGDVGQKGVTTLLVALTAFIALLPTLVINFVKGLVEIAEGVAKLAPDVVSALDKVLTTVIQFVADQAPKLAVAITALLSAFLTVINTNAGPIINAGLNLIRNFLSAIANNIGPIVTTAGTIISRFLSSLATQMPKIIASGVKLVVSFIKGITQNMAKLLTSGAQLVAKFLMGVTQHLPDVLAKAGKLIATFLTGIANQIPQVIRAGVRIITKIIDGIGDAIPRVIDAGVRVVRKFLNGIAKAIPDLVDAGFKAVIKFLNGIERAIRENDQDLIDAGFGIADAIIDGLLLGFKELGHKAIEAVEDLALALPNAALHKLGIKSPSKVFWQIGKWTAWGLAWGLHDNKKAPVQATNEIVQAMVDELGKMKGGVQASALMEDIGKDLGKSFIKGLTGSKEDIQGAFTGLRGRLNEEMKTLREQIATDRAKLTEELAKKTADQDPQAIAELTSAIKTNTTDLGKMTAARRFLISGLKDEKNQLKALSGQYGKIQADLDKAQEGLKQLIADRKALREQLTQQYGELPTIDQDTDPTAYIKALQERTAAVNKYKNTLMALRDQGLDDETFKQLLQQGTSGQQFADQLLAGGKPAIDQINALDDQLAAAAESLGKEAAKSMYKIGIENAKGLINGLKSQRGTIAEMMEKLADAMVKAIKKKLRIKSPSQEFDAIGQFIIKGLARGLEDSSAPVEAAHNLGTDVLTAMSDAIGEGVDVDPVITPVLDLTDVEKKAQMLNSMMPTPTLTASTSLDEAASISALKAQLDSEAAAAAAGTTATAPVVTLEQNNYSPDPLSAIELYRQTNNQLSQLRRVLGLTH